MRVRRFDFFALANFTLWAWMAWAVHRKRLAFFRGEPSLAEFFFYASLMTVLLALTWVCLRRFAWHPVLLGVVEVVIVVAIAAGVVTADGTRLYDCVVLSIRFDKYVHLCGSLVAALGVGAILNAFGARPRRLAGAVIVLVVLGGGAIWEIVEYLVVRTFPDAGVGAYDNNMQDLIANLAGGLLSRALPYRWREALERVPGAAPRPHPAVAMEPGVGRRADRVRGEAG